MKSKSGFFRKIGCLAFVLSLFLVPMQSALAEDGDGIAIQKDVYLNWPILSVEDLPDELTVSLFDAANAAIPLATQTFKKGEYTLDFELSKSDGVQLGPIARLSVNFTNKLNLGDDADNPTRVRQIWSEVSLDGAPLGLRSRVSDETMVRLLLASDASLATYVTFAYEGDTNPLTTIYQSLPLASGQSGKEFVNSLFSSVPVGYDLGAANNWVDSGSNVYTLGTVGVKTTSPTRDIAVSYSSSGSGLDALPTVSVANTKTSTGTTDFSFASFEFSGNNGGTVGEFFADGSGYFLGGTPSVVFRSSTNSPLLLGTNKVIQFILTTAGYVGIGTTSPSYNLAVNGTIGCKELTVTTTGWSDFVFDKDYRLPALNEVEDFIAENKHLPGIPSESQVKESGVSVGEMSSKLLQKIEELTLYVIDLKKENESLKGELATIRSEINQKTN